jgi:hypothetical protein
MGIRVRGRQEDRNSRLQVPVPQTSSVIVRRCVRHSIQNERFAYHLDVDVPRACRHIRQAERGGCAGNVRRQHIQGFVGVSRVFVVDRRSHSVGIVGMQRPVHCFAALSHGIRDCLAVVDPGLHFAACFVVIPLRHLHVRNLEPKSP